MCTECFNIMCIHQTQKHTVFSQTTESCRKELVQWRCPPSDLILFCHAMSKPIPASGYVCSLRFESPLVPAQHTCVAVAKGTLFVPP
ncbi:unnamed protein product, partial [Ixodes persulcatus]